MEAAVTETDLDDYDLKIFDRLFSRVSELENGCLVYTWGKDKDGYGWMGYRNKQKRTSQLAYHLCIGDIPQGMHVLHSCDNPPCCNPKHLFLGNDKINTNDKMAKDRHLGLKGSELSLMLNEEMVVEIKALIAGDITYREIAQKFNVSISCINHIANGRTWNHVQLGEVSAC